MAKTFQSLNPVTGDVIATYPITSTAQVYEATTIAYDAFERWSALGFRNRRKILLAYSDAILKEIDHLSDLVTLETGKPHSDA
ncbi:MAG: aldehyde dehydrogenase family protein, partial [Actinobacteria bacterium]|nr:aldehyde dehydrogenase family protein [Actinomycetota bacterium]